MICCETVPSAMIVFIPEYFRIHKAHGNDETRILSQTHLCKGVRFFSTHGKWISIVSKKYFVWNILNIFSPIWKILNKNISKIILQYFKTLIWKYCKRLFSQIKRVVMFTIYSWILWLFFGKILKCFKDILKPELCILKILIFNTV